MNQRRNSRTPRRPPQPSEVEAGFWQLQIRQLGRKVLYVDTGAILECLNPNDEQYNAFFDGVVGDRLVTSSYVVVETVRRLVKSKPNQFKGPAGQQASKLAVHFLHCWLEEREVSVLHIPEEIFGTARREFERREGIGCDLTDVISYVIVVGLQQKRIVSPDLHFQSLALTCLP